MSHGKPNPNRNKTDHYATQPWVAAWAIDKALELVKQHSGETDRDKMTMLEPGCGLFAPFTKRSAHHGIDSYGLDMMYMGNPERGHVPAFPHQKMSFYGHCDFLDCKQYPLDPAHRFDIIATNPPFKLGWKFVADALDLLKPRGIMMILQKRSFVHTPDRYKFMQKNMPIFEFPCSTIRLGFTGNGKTDSQEYSIFCWGGSEIEKKIRRRHGKGYMTVPQDNRAWIERWNGGWDK